MVQHIEKGKGGKKKKNVKGNEKNGRKGEG